MRAFSTGVSRGRCLLIGLANRMLNLVLAASPPFADRALNLIESYQRNSNDGRIIFCHFGGMKRWFLNMIEATYGDRIVVREIEPVCPHAYNPRFFFFKLFAIREAARLGEPFIYLDCSEAIVRPTAEFERQLNERTRVFVQYPRIDFFRNGNWTTRRCLEKMRCTEQRYLDCHQYMGGIQAYLPTAENLTHIEEMYRLMLDPEIAGPENIKALPEGEGGCRAHRNDQSVLSTLIERNGWHQPHDPAFYMDYGDMTCPTHSAMVRAQVGAKPYDPVIVSRVDQLEFIPKRTFAQKSLWKLRHAFR
jgi:hypothetical protein